MMADQDRLPWWDDIQNLMSAIHTPFGPLGFPAWLSGQTGHSEALFLKERKIPLQEFDAMYY